MKLIQAKLRGTGPLLSSSWFQLSEHLNQFYFSTPLQGTTFLRALQTLQPPFSCPTADPFGELPRHEKRGPHTRHINAAKRTIALGVFAATAEMVAELGLLDDNLYETDRIEIGRRLDYSRWLNFVEVSSSTRWKEIEPDIAKLLSPLRQLDVKKYEEAISITGGLKGSDRIKGEIADSLLFYLQHTAQQNNAMHKKIVHLIGRNAHFQKARQLVRRRLPLFIYCNSQGNIAPPVSETNQCSTEGHQELLQCIKDEHLHLSAGDSAGENVTGSDKSTVVERLRTGIHHSLAVCKNARRMEPIFLFDAPETNVPPAAHNQLQQLIKDTAQSQQCIYLSGSKNFFSRKDTGKNYTCADLLQTGT